MAQDPANVRVSCHHCAERKHVRLLALPSCSGLWKLGDAFSLDPSSISAALCCGLGAGLAAFPSLELVPLGTGVQPNTCRKVPCFWETGRHPGLITPGGAGHFLSTFSTGTLSRELCFAPRVVTGFSSTWGGQKPVRGSSRVVPWCCEVQGELSCVSAGVQNSAGEQRATCQPHGQDEQAIPGR